MKNQTTITVLNTISLLLACWLCVSLLSVGTIQAQTTYYTLTPGDWNNTTIWSLDGVTPCLCRPSKTLDTFDIEIRNHVVVNQSINVLNGSTLSFSGVSSLTGNADISNASGTLDMAGVVLLNGIGIRNFNQMDITGSLLQTSANFFNRGILLNYGDLNIDNGNLTNVESSTINLFAGSSFTLTNGVFDNYGALYLENVCVQISGGDMNNMLHRSGNRSGGRVFGNGAIDLSGNLFNESTWETTVDWCAAGTDQGMRHQENCSSTACSTLPVDFLSVSAEPIQNPEVGGVAIEWATFREHNNHFFTLENSVDNEHFSEIFRIDSKGDTESGHSYGYQDTAPQNGRNFYRIKQTDFDGASTYSSTVEVMVQNDNQLNFVCFPNPTQGRFKVRFRTSEREEVEGKLFDLNGRLVQQFSYTAQSGVQEIPLNIEALPEGYYLLRLFTANTIETVKLVKTM